MQRPSPIWRRFRARLAAASGAIDLASLMVGVIVIGVISSIAVATVFAIIPWSQDKAAQESLRGVKDAQSVAFARYNAYFDGNGLVAKGLLPQKVAVTAEGTIDGGRGAAVVPHLLETRSPVGIPGVTVNSDGSCYVSAVLSQTGAVYWNSSQNPTPQRAIPGVNAQPDTSSCAPFPDVAAWPLPLVITTASIPNAVIGHAYSTQIAWTGTATPTFTVTSGNTPQGISLSSSGLLSGTPAGSTMTRTFTVTGTSSNGNASTTYTMTVGTAPSLPATTTLPPGTNGVAYSASIVATGDSPLTYAVTSGTLPSGLTMSTAGVITGTPTVTGTSTFTVTATNGSGTAQTVVSISTAKPFAVTGPAIAEGGSTAYAVDASSNGVSWGQETAGQLGQGTINSSLKTPTVMVGGTKLVSISGGLDYALGLDSSGHLFGWGNNSYNELGPTSLPSPQKPTALTSPAIFQMVSAGYDTSVALDANGHVYSWGRNSFGEAGMGTAAAITTPTLIPSIQNQTFTWVSSGYHYMAAIDTNGHLWTWGTNSSGDLGNGSTTTNFSVPTEIVSSQTFTKVATQVAGQGDTLAIDTSGHLWAWGRNVFGQLGVGDKNDRSVPTEVTATKTYSAIAVGYYATYAVDTAGNLYSSGFGQYGELGLAGNSQVTVPTQVTIGSPVSAIAANGTTVLALTSSGSYYSWGQNSVTAIGAVGDGSTTNRSTPVKITIP